MEGAQELPVGRTGWAFLWILAFRGGGGRLYPQALRPAANFTSARSSFPPSRWTSPAPYPTFQAPPATPLAPSAS